MDKQAIAKRLQALASDDNHRSKAARLRDVIDDVEIALAAGVSRTAVLNELSAHGLPMSLSTFETTLKRIRLKNAKRQTTPTSLPQRQIEGKPSKPRHAPSTIETRPSPEEQSTSHNPADLDKIISGKPDLAALAKLSKRKIK